MSRPRPRYAPALRDGGSLADVLPSVLAVLGVPGAADALGLAPALDGVRRVAVLLVDGLGWHQLPAAAPHAPTLAGLAGRPRGPAAHRRLPVHDADQPGHARHRRRARRARGARASASTCPAPTGCSTTSDWGDDPDPREWQPVPTAVRARPRAAGVAVDRREPARVRAAAG